MQLTRFVTMWDNASLVLDDKAIIEENIHYYITIVFMLLFLINYFIKINLINYFYNFNIFIFLIN